jgi:two-component system sensor histidine kinase/response regulator
MPQAHVTDTSTRLAAADTALLRGDESVDAPTAVEPASPTAPTKVVLVAQDTAVNQMLARGLLEGIGYVVEFAVNGLEAVAAATATPGRFAAILMGCELPRLDGYEATRVIRQLEGPGLRVPIIALAASAHVAESERCLAAGMDDVLVRPVDFDLLEAMLARWVDGVLPDEDPDDDLDETGLLDMERIRTLEDLQVGEGSFFAVCVQSFLARLPEDLQAIQTAVDAADPSLLVAAAHALKGSAQNLGAAEVGRSCRALEEAAERLDHSEAAELMAGLRLQAGRTVVALQAALTSPAV